MTIKSLRQYFAPDVAAASTAITSMQNDLKVYNTPNDLPLTDVKSGQQAYVISNKGLYVWAGTGWYSIATITTDLTLTETANVAYNLGSNGTPLTVNLAATSSNPISWTYGTTKVLGATTIENTGGSFTITPSTDVANDGGVFLINFSASDSTGTVGATSQFTIAYPVGTLHGWWAAGGKVPTDRIEFASDTTTAVARGASTTGLKEIGAAGNEDYGWWAGGSTWSRIERIDYADDATTAAIRGPLTIGRRGLSGHGNLNYGWFGSGWNPAAGGMISVIDRVDYAADTGTATLRGTMGTSTYQSRATSNDNYGWWGGGQTGPSYSTITNMVRRITFASDTSTSQRGNLSAARRYPGAAGNADYGWFAGGYSYTLLSAMSIVDRINYASDGSTAAVRGPLTGAAQRLAATGNPSYGWFNIGLTSKVERIDYAADTVTASLRGPLTQSRENAAAAGGYPG